MAAFPTTVATDSDLYVAVNNLATQVTDNPLTSGATTANVASTTGFPSVGFISIDDEIIKYTGKTLTSFTGCTRGADGTTAASHVQNSQAFHNVIAAHHNAIKDDLIATEQFISDLIGRTNTQIQAPAGSATTPSISFAGDLNSGIYSAGADAVGISTNGVARVIWNTTAMNLQTGILGLQDGGVGSPALAFVNDPDTGLYRASANDMVLTCGATQIAEFTTTAIFTYKPIYGIDGTQGAPTFSFANDQDTGMYRNTSGEISFSCNNSERMRLEPSAIAGNMSILLYDVSAGTTVRVTRGAADSGGVGFRVLRVPN